MSGQSARTRPPVATTTTDSQYACPQCPTCGDSHERDDYHHSGDDTY